MHNFNTRSPLIFLGSHGGEKNHQEFLTIRSHVLGPIKRPLTASNQPKHRKTLKNGNKTQVGRKSYLLELSKTPKSGVHALSSTRRTASLLAPSTADGRISRDLREKLSLSLKLSQKWWLLEEFWFFTFFALDFKWRRRLLAILSSSHLKSNSKIPVISLLLRFDIRHYLGRPFSSFLYSYHLWYMSTCYLCISSHRKSVYGTRTAMPRKTCRHRLSPKIMKFYVLTRFRETIPTVQSVSSSEI